MEKKQFEEERLHFVNRVEALISLEMFPEALQLAQERFSKLPFDVDATSYLNLILIILGKNDESRNILQELEKKIIQLSFVYLKSAEAYQKKNLKQDAVLNYQKFFAFNPFVENSEEIIQKIALLQGEENQINETVELDEINDPGPEFYTITLAELYIKQGHVKMASHVLTQIIKREPDNIKAREILDLVNANLIPKLSFDDNNAETINILINTLTDWLNNLGRLRTHAT